MADTKISALTAASALAGTEAFPVVQSGSTVKATPAQIRTYLKSPRMLFVDHTDAASSHTDGTPDALYTHDIAANTLAANGDSIEFEFFGVTVAHATALRLFAVGLGGGNFVSATAAPTVTGDAGNWYCRGTIIRKSATVARVFSDHLILSSVDQEIYAQDCALKDDVTGLDFTTALDVTMYTIVSGTGAAAADVVARQGLIRYWPAP